MDDSAKEIRKLRKKLRQIHHLSALTRALNDQELHKLSQFDDVQERLNVLLAAQDGNASCGFPIESDHPSLPALDARGDTSGRSDDDNDTTVQVAPSPTKMARKEVATRNDEAPNEGEIELRDEQMIDASKESDIKEGTSHEQQQQFTTDKRNRKQQQLRHEKDNDAGTDEERKNKEQPQREDEEERKKHEQQHRKNEEERLKAAHQVQQRKGTEERKQEDRRTAARRQPWWKKKPRFFVQELVGHSDIVLDVSISDGLVASASRDTLVKVWSLDTGLLECTLSGHTEAVQACVLLPLATTDALLTTLALPAGVRLVVTGGGDSTLLLWRIDCAVRSGAELRRQYIFTPVTCLVSLTDEGALVFAVGTSSGKIEVWDLLAGTQRRSRAVHRSPVTSIRPAGSGLLVSCAEGGEVALHRADTLAPLFVAGDATPRPDRHRLHLSGARTVLGLDPGAEWLLVGDAGSSLKLLHRGQRDLRKVPNSRQEFGVCDALWAAGPVVFATAFDVDTARGFVNVFDCSNPAQPTYLRSVQPPHFAGRYLCLDGVLGRDGVAAMVTGGVELLLWQQVGNLDEFTAAECASSAALALYRSREDEWSQGETSASSSDAGWTDDSDAEEEEAGAASTVGWSWWRCVVL